MHNVKIIPYDVAHNITGKGKVNISHIYYYKAESIHFLFVLKTILGCSSTGASLTVTCVLQRTSTVEPLRFRYTT